MINVLVSGRNGFLLRNTINDKKWNIIEYKDSEEYSNIDLVIHFASPSDSFEFKDKERMAETMVDLTIRILNEAVANNCKFIFASSMAADNPENEYGFYKRAMEQYIQAIHNNSLILRIPRVYGKDRNKGLMRKIRQGLIPKNEINNEIQYIDIEDFKVWFNENLNKNGILYYNNEFRTNTIKEIGEIYCES